MLVSASDLRRHTINCMALALLILTPAVASGQSSQSSDVRNGEPAVAPDGKFIAYESDCKGKTRLLLMRSDGSRPVGLTATSAEIGAPGWSKDARKILSSISSGQTSELFAIDRRTLNRRLIAHVPGRNPRLAPDGRRIVYMAGTYLKTKLMVVDINGSRTLQVSEGDGPAWNAQWSPDGQRIAYTSRAGSSDPLNLFLMKSDGTGRMQVTHFDRAQGNAQWPAWSPDGCRLAFQVNQIGKSDAQIWVVDLASGVTHNLSPHDHAYLDETPSWFPDGEHLAVQSNRTGQMQVWVISVDGSSARQLTRSLWP